MTRKSIFDIVKENNDITKDLMRINEIMTNSSCIQSDELRYYSPFNYFSYYIFEDWKQRGHCLNFNDFLDQLDFKTIYYNATTLQDSNSIVIVLELFSNIWEQINRMFIPKENDFYHAKTIIDDCLSDLNLKEFFIHEEDKYIIIEDNPATTAVAEIIDKSTALDIIRYNHYSLKGQLKEKQQILKLLSDVYESRKLELSKIDNTFKKNIDFLINNLNIRHNNIDKTSKEYHEFIAKMTDDELESWYDETYQMLLLAFLRMDNVERSTRVTELKRKISENNNR